MAAGAFQERPWRRRHPSEQPSQVRSVLAIGESFHFLRVQEAGATCQERAALILTRLLSSTTHSHSTDTIRLFTELTRYSNPLNSTLLLQLALEGIYGLATCCLVPRPSACQRGPACSIEPHMHAAFGPQSSYLVCVTDFLCHIYPFAAHEIPVLKYCVPCVDASGADQLAIDEQNDSCESLRTRTDTAVLAASTSALSCSCSSSTSSDAFSSCCASASLSACC